MVQTGRERFGRLRGMGMVAVGLCGLVGTGRVRAGAASWIGNAGKGACLGVGGDPA